MTIPRWKVMAGVLGVSLGGLAAMAGQCPKPDDTRTNRSEPPMTAEAQPKVPPAGAPAKPASPTIDLPALPVIPAGAATSGPTLPTVSPTAPSTTAPGSPAPTVPPSLTPPTVDFVPAKPAVGSPTLPPSPVIPVVGVEPTKPTGVTLPPAGPDLLPPAKPTPTPPAPAPASNLPPAPPSAGVGVPPSAPPSPTLDPLLVPDRAPTVPSSPTTPVAAVQTKFRIILRVGEGDPSFEVRHGDDLVMKVLCEKVDIKSPEKGQGLSEVTATGKVRFVGFGAEGTCDSLSFLAGTGEVSMSGKVKVQVKDKIGRVESELTTDKMQYKIDASAMPGTLKP